MNHTLAVVLGGGVIAFIFAGVVAFMANGIGWAQALKGFAVSVGVTAVITGAALLISYGVGGFQ